MPPLEIKTEKKKANEQSFKFNESAKTRVLFMVKGVVQGAFFFR